MHAERGGVGDEVETVESLHRPVTMGRGCGFPGDRS